MTNEYPKHIAIIMDGNGTWAEQKGLPRLNGHRAGVEALKNIIENIKDTGVKYLTVYAFSTENWNRDEQEVNGLMDLLREYLKSNDLEKLNNEGVRVSILGDKEDKRIPKDLLETISDVEEKTKDNKKYFFNLAFNYGGKNEIINAIKKIPNEKIKTLTEDDFSSYLYTKDMPDPDLIIRTGGQTRISNFLLWQSAYSEYIFTDTLWPDFNKEELDKEIEEYKNRKRTFGKR